MTLTEQKVAAKKFATKWADKGDEKQDTRAFWEELMEDVLGIEGARDVIFTEYPVDINGHQKYIDILFKEQEILIEQKSANKSLNKRYQQSGGDMLTPFEQGRRYAGYLPYGINVRWVIACNFQQFEIHDLKKPGEAPTIIDLSNLPNDIGLFRFFVSQKDEDIKRELDISIEAGEIVGRLYDALREKYVYPDDPESQRYLNILVTRLVFCMYAEDAGLFGDNNNRFQDYVRSKDPESLNEALERLFRILDTPEEVRAKKSNIPASLKAFPYVNGGLFEEEDIEIPLFDEELKKTLTEDACAFNWCEISPTIFGAVFESTLNPETRRAGGMHYTSVENIHKVIDPLFLDELKEELRSIQATAEKKGYKQRLLKYQEKLSSMRFLDPACGSGNFLTETYLSLRRLENQAIAERFGGQQAFGDVFEKNPIRVSINQFYGIEINDFAVTVARTALWIAEAQMLEETEEIIRSQIEFFPLKTNAFIVEGDSLTLDWDDVVCHNKLDYIMGNPPFVGKKEQSKSQKAQVKMLFSDETKKAGVLDYVSCWFLLASRYMLNHKSVRTGFVATDSLCQGEHVPALWEVLVEKYNIKIDFAYRTFKWSNETTKNKQAEVYCVIVGFSNELTKTGRRIIYNGDNYSEVEHVSPYLIPAPDIWLKPRQKQISHLPQMSYGSMPIDNGYLILSEDDKAKLESKEPNAMRFVRLYAGAEELLKGNVRYCLWLTEASRKDILHSSFITERVNGCKSFRESSNRSATKKLALTPELFGEIRQPEGEMIVIPKVSSKHRRYIPVVRVSSNEYIINGSALIIPSDDKVLFGILSSNVHNAWIRAIAETWGHSYQYSTDIYNNFPVPDIEAENKTRIEESANRIMSVRQNHSDLTLAEMYNPKVGIIKDLLLAHQANDMAVMEAYRFYNTDASGKKHWYTEEETVAELMKMYQELNQPEKDSALKKQKATVKIKVRKKN